MDILHTIRDALLEAQDVLNRSIYREILRISQPSRR